MLTVGIVIAFAGVFAAALIWMAEYMCPAPSPRSFVGKAAAAIISVIVGVILILFSFGCVSLTEEQRDRIEDVLQKIPTPTPTPEPTPTPAPTPLPTPEPDISLNRIQRDLPEYAATKGIPLVNAGRGDMLDFRGRSDFDAVFSEWCGLTGGAAMPAVTDANEHGEFYQCR